VSCRKEKIGEWVKIVGEMGRFKDSKIQEEFKDSKIQFRVGNLILGNIED
jgi:hypothetical protein